MKRFPTAQAVILAGLLTALGCSPSDQETALAMIRQAGGNVSHDDLGRVVSVDLSDTPATDEELAAIRVFPDVRTINCTNARGIKGTDLDVLVDLKNLETLYLVGTSLDDTGLSRLKDLKSLKTLHLGRTNITDAGMPALDNLTNLQTLSLGNTAVTDAGLIQLRDLRNLSTLILRDTKVTPRGIQELRRMLPDARIDD
jgi:Leucine-rich repeat (LRR) protein